MAVTTLLRVRRSCTLESELDLGWGEGTSCFCAENGGKWWRIDNGAWVWRGLGGYHSPTALKTINGNSLFGSGNIVISGGGAASITETEIDVGTTPVAEASISVTDAAVTASSKIIGGIAYKAPTGKDMDELEMDDLELKFEPGTGTFNVKIKGREGYISDKFIIWYQVAA